MISLQVQYKAKFDKEKGLRPKYDMKESVIYKTQKDAHKLASEVRVPLSQVGVVLF